MGLWEQFPYPDYHNLNLDWILQKIKEFGVTIDGLDEYIEQKIKEGLDALGLEQIVIDILSKYAYAINVKTPPNGLLPASGNGTTNDYATIQGCIDYASSIGGGVVFFPYGKYLTNSLSMRSNVSILGFDQYSTELILSGGANKPLLSGTIDNVSISGLTLNAKQSSQVNNIDAVELLGHHINIENVIAEDCYTSINIEKNGTSIVIKNVICNIASEACLRVSGTNGGLLVDGLDMTGLTTNLGTAYIVTDSNGDIYRNINIHGTGAIGIVVSGSGNYFDGKISDVTKDYDDISGDNTFNLFGKTRIENLTGEVVVNAGNIRMNATNILELFSDELVLNYMKPIAINVPTGESLKSLTLKVGKIYVTGGRLVNGDGGEGVYLITSSLPENVIADGGMCIPIQNGFAVLLSKTVNTRQYGIMDNVDCFTQLNAFLNAASYGRNLNIIKGNYYVNGTAENTSFISLPADSIIDFNYSLVTLDGYAFITNYKPNGVYPEYTGPSNIVLKNATIITGENNMLFSHIRIGHASNVIVENITSKNIPASHALEFAGCKECKAINCLYTEERYTATEDYTLVQIEHTGEANAPLMQPYDNTVCKNITIENCMFDGENGGISACIETHAVNTIPITHTGIRIIGNTFSNCNLDVLEIVNCDDIVIENNIVKDCKYRFVAPTKTIGGTDYMIHGGVISGNIIDGGGRTNLDFAEPCFKLNALCESVEISGNLIKNYNQGAVIFYGGKNFTFNSNIMTDICRAVKTAQPSRTISPIEIRSAVVNIVVCDNYIDLSENTGVECPIDTDGQKFITQLIRNNNIVGNAVLSEARASFTQSNNTIRVIDKDCVFGSQTLTVNLYRLQTIIIRYGLYVNGAKTPVTSMLINQFNTDDSIVIKSSNVIGTKLYVSEMQITGVNTSTFVIASNKTNVIDLSASPAGITEITASTDTLTEGCLFISGVDGVNGFNMYSYPN
jgi:hypothetical protein